MKISKLNIVNNIKDIKILAYFDIETSEGIVIKKFRLIKGNNSMFVAAPNERGKDGRYYDTVYLSKAQKIELHAMASEEYNNQLAIQANSNSDVLKS